MTGLSQREVGGPAPEGSKRGPISVAHRSSADVQQRSLHSIELTAVPNVPKEDRIPRIGGAVARSGGV
jgi:hypothetical protein